MVSLRLTLRLIFISLHVKGILGVKTQCKVYNHVHVYVPVIVRYVKTEMMKERRLRSILTFFLESVEILDDLDSSCTKIEVDLVFDYCTA